MENYEFEIISEQYARFRNTKKLSSRLNIPKILLINILELLAAVNAGVVSDTENKLFTNVLNEWLETSYDIVNT